MDCFRGECTLSISHLLPFAASLRFFVQIENCVKNAKRGNDRIIKIVDKTFLLLQFYLRIATDIISNIYSVDFV